MTTLFFVITFIPFPLWMSIFLKTLLICYGMCFIFWDGAFFSTYWMSELARDLLINVFHLVNGQWLMLTDVFRTFLFFILLSIMSYLLYYWTVHVRRVMIFLIFTVVYVTVVDTFMVYDATYAIIRTFIIGFLLLGLVTIYRRLEAEDVKMKTRFLPFRLAILLVMIIGAGSLFGLLFPKFEPQWDDPVPFVKAAIGIDEGGSGGGGGVQKIGYGDNDDQLGGGFLDDNTPVFYAVTKQSHYWRGETKDYYTGKGWISTTPFLEGLEPYATIEAETYEAEIVFANGISHFSHLFYPGRLLTNDSIMDVDLSLDFYTSKAETFLDENPVNLSHYFYEYSLPRFHVDTLRSASEDDPDYIREYYTQLPETLPDRVRDLAEKLVENFDNRYDKVKAVENYLTSSTFKYETTNVPVPEENEDYVDQFLFETQRGYCDNFSTAMIVLLRTQNIPARWAKGFTQGDRIEALDEDRYIYQVTNSNAHSWVEVYFPEIGWIPFEPTRGFTQAYAAIDLSINPNNIGQENEEDELDVQDQEEKEEEVAFSNHPFFTKGLKSNVLLFVITGGLLILLFVLFRSNRLAHYYTLRRFQNRTDDEAFIPAFEKLLLLLERFGHPRKSSETLREYATRIDQHFSTNEMIKLTTAYEKITYGDKSNRSSWQEHKKDWEALLERIKS